MLANLAQGGYCKVEKAVQQQCQHQSGASSQKAEQETGSCDEERISHAAASSKGYIDTAVKILIAVVLGALLLAGLYALFGDVVMPTLNERITNMFNYAGALE